MESESDLLGIPPKHTVLFIGRYSIDSAALAQTLSGTHWAVLHVRTCQEAVALLSTTAIPVVICDEDPFGCDWKTAVHAVTHAPHAAPAIVAATSGDWHLWQEVIDKGGFDMVRKPFRRQRLVAALDLAMEHWKHGHVRRAWEDFRLDSATA